MSTPPSEKKIAPDSGDPSAAASGPNRAGGSEPRVQGTLAYLSLGFEFLGAFLMFAGGGYAFDYVLSESGRPGFGFILGLFLGFGGGIWHLVRRSNELQELEEKYAREREAVAESSAISASSSSEDIQERLRRVQSGVDATHRKLGAALDGIPDRAPRAKPQSDPAKSVQDPGGPAAD